MGKYYNNNKLLSLMDINGNRPEIFICDGNRAAGKTYSFKSTLLKRWFKNDEQFVLIVRNQVDAKGYAEAFWKDIGNDKYRGHECKEKAMAKGMFYEVSIDDRPAGYVLPLSMCAKLKRYSSLFINVTSMFFDEYQDENARYLTNEIDKLMSLHTSIARGHGEQARYVPVYMCSNTITILNPYYIALGIHKRLRNNTKFIRGEGWVFEKTLNESAKEAFEDSAFNMAFKGTTIYGKHAAENIYLNDNMALVKKPRGSFAYRCSIKYRGSYYSVRIYQDFVYIAEGYDKTYPVKAVFDAADMDEDGFILYSKYSWVGRALQKSFEEGNLRFQTLACKDAIFDILSL